MNFPRRRIVLVLIAILLMGAGLLWIATWPTYAQDELPNIPHPLEGRNECLACHETGAAGVPRIPDDHAGRTSSTCTTCHQPAEIPQILHLPEGREDCLACHQTGIGFAPKVPNDHAGRTNEFCVTCHQPAVIPEVPHSLEGRDYCFACHATTETLPATPGESSTPQDEEVVPTPIAYPAPSGEANSCFDCHSGLPGVSGEKAQDWQTSIHAEREVICSDCHGGDPNATNQEDAMSEAAGYIGVPDRTEIPNLCGSCHANVDLMRQYNLPTDQLAKYKESFHGQQLASGDTKVATCYDCHDGHATRETNDPQASVYVLNVPELCASCHADTDYMAGYNIPTDQYDLYVTSVHGEALLDRQDTRAPNCATCHGTHGAAPPGFGEVANVCGSCHTATQDYYLQSPHSDTSNPNSPDCVRCHGRYDVHQPSEENFLGTEPRHCGECHAPDSTVGKQVAEIYQTLSDADTAYQAADAAVKESAAVGHITAQEDNVLAEARTSLITGRAAQHTVSLDTVKEQTENSIELSNQALDLAQKAIAEHLFRRQAMVIVIAGIGLVIVSLVLLRRELVRRSQ